MTDIIKMIDLKNFPIERTVFFLLQEQDQRKELIKNEIKGWKEKFPSAVSVIEKYEKQTEKEFNEMDETVDKAVLNYFYSFNIENDILRLVEPETAQKIGDLLKAGGGNEIIELAKEVAREQQADLESEVKKWKAGVAGLTFLLESVEKYYLVNLPNYIKTKLEIVEPVALGELDQEKLKTNLGSIYSTLYAGFSDTEKETNFKDFQEKINTELGNIKTLIDEKRKSKEPEKPKEDVEGIKNQLATANSKLKEWTDKFGDKTPQQVFDNQEHHKPEDLKPVNEELELGIEEDTPLNQSKKKLIAEIKRLCKLKNITPHFYKDKDKLPETTQKDNIHLFLNQTDNNGDFSPNLVLLNTAEELAHLETNSREKVLVWWKELVKEQEWVKDNLSSDYQKEFELLLNPSTFPTDKLDINKVLLVNDLENITATSSESFSVNKSLVDKCWQIVKDKAIDWEFKAVVDYSADYTITINYNSDSSHVKDIERLMIETPLKVENEYLKSEKGKLPTQTNYDKLVRQNQLYDRYLKKETNKDTYTRLKGEIDKIN